MRFEASESFARKLDAEDPLREFRKSFLIPKASSGEPAVYLNGNSLGLQPVKAKEYVDAELEDWARFGVEGHHQARHPWISYHELATESLARVVGAKPLEVVAMNSLTVNLHLMLASFYKPMGKRRKILIEAGAFPSDQYAVDSQLRLHGLDPMKDLIEASGDIADRINDEVALVLLGQVNYLTGEAFDVPSIVAAARRKGCRVGLDLAHGAGNLPLSLHDWDVDFAVWCGYKYLNAGPGAIAGCFVHDRHGHGHEPRLAGWWGHDKKTRFAMPREFRALPGAEGWQLSNPPILQLAALRASLELFDRARMARLREKSELLTRYLEFLIGGSCEIITPTEPARRGCQLSLRFKEDRLGVQERLKAAGIICDVREPDVIRAAPVPLYNTFLDVYRFSEALKSHGKAKAPAAR